MIRRMISLLAVIICFSSLARAGGPAFVAGSAFDPSVKGQPVVWANGSVQYFTDQGDLSPILPNAQADAFVAAAFLPWTSISGVALTTTQGGHLAEDVNGSNVSCDAQGNCAIPTDIQPTAVTTPVGIV